MTVTGTMTGTAGMVRTIAGATGMMGMVRTMAGATGMMGMVRTMAGATRMMGMVRTMAGALNVMHVVDNSLRLGSISCILLRIHERSHSNKGDCDEMFHVI